MTPAIYAAQLAAQADRDGNHLAAQAIRSYAREMEK